LEKRSFLNRRKFLASGAITAAAGLAGREAQALQSGVGSAGRPYFTRVPGKKIVGCYCSINDILNSPKYIDALQEKLGVNCLLCGSPIRLSDRLLAMNPLDNKRVMNVSGHTEDDSSIFKAVEEIHRRGMDFWLYFTGHHYGEESRSIISETFDGVAFLDLPRVKYSLESMKTSCFAKPKVKAFEPAVFSYAAKRYDVDSMYVSHYRYTNPSFWTNLFGCACSYCQEEAANMGYDFPRMRDSMMNLRRSLETLDKKTLEHAAKFRLTFTDFLTLVGEDDGVMDWFLFRAKVVGNQLKRIHDAVHTATNHLSGFITDTHNPTMSILVGHNWADLIGGASDALHPLSWCGSQHISAVASWANQLCEWVDGLDESTALKLVTSFFGWDELGLPDKKIADLRIGETEAQHGSFSNPENAFNSYFNPDLTIRLMTHEWTRMTAINRGRIPAHPVIKGDAWPEKVGRELMERADDLELTGYILQRTHAFIDREKL